MNFIHISMPDKDRLLFFGDPDDTPFTVFGDGLTMADLALEVGKFPSLSQARKNGWNKPIPPGFSSHKIGKKKFWVLNSFGEQNE